MSGNRVCLGHVRCDIELRTILSTTHVGGVERHLAQTRRTIVRYDERAKRDRLLCLYTYRYSNILQKLADSESEFNYEGN